MKVNTLQLKRVVSTVLFVLLLSAAGMTKSLAQSFTVGALNYSVNSDGVSVTVTGHVNGTSATGTLNIPETVNYEGNDYAVTAIGSDAFSYCDGFTGNLVIPNSVTTIGDYAFDNCYGFTGNLVIPNSVTTIGDYAFFNCPGFTGDLVIPNSVTTIADGAFFGCIGFSYVEYYVTDCCYISVWDPPFAYCGGTLIIGENVERIPAYMFGAAAFIQIISHAEMPPTVGAYAFYDIDHDIQVYVPCGSLSDYQNAEGWNEFTNIFVIGFEVEEEFTMGNINYSVNCDGTTVTATGHVDGTAATGELVIPETVTYNESTYSVTAIGNDSFSNCYGFTGDLIIPNSVTTIGDYAFIGCEGFTGNLTIGSGVTSIREGAFWGCTGFTGDLVIPNSVTHIDDHAFSGCIGFTGNLVIPNSVTRIGGGAFNNCIGFSSVEYNATNCADVDYSPFNGCGGTLIIGENVERIPNNMFEGAAFTGSLIIPNSVTFIGDYAFGGCEGFTGNLIIPNSVTTIGSYAFVSCIGFTGDLVIPNSVASIGGGAFSGCTGFSSVEYNATDYAYVHDYLHVCPFYYCGGTLTIGENMERIPDHMFAYAAFTGSLIIPNSVTFIGDYAFGGCTGFTGDLVIPNSVTHIDDHAFSGCIGFTGNLVIPNSVTRIGGGAFNNCIGFSSVEYNATNCADASDYYPPFSNCGGTLIIGENVERIPANMFEYAAFTGSLIIPNSVTSIGSWAFSSCTGFTGNLVIPNSVTKIRSGTFHGCSGFTGNLVIPNSITIIGDDAFCYCSGFTGNLVIPNSVTTIGEYAFYDCTGFSSVEYNATNCADASYYNPPFSNCGGTLIIGENVERIPNNMFSAAAFIQIISHAEMPPIVGWHAFYGIDHNIPVYVPCGTLSDYQNADGWNEFNNIFSSCLEITAAVIPANSGTVTGAGTYDMFTTCTLTAIANEGYTFLYWTEDETVVSTDATYSFVVTEDRNLIANFTIITYHVTVVANSAEGGIVTGTGTYEYGSSVNITATANDGYSFANWTENGAIVSMHNSYTFSIYDNHDFVANFTINTYNVTVTANPAEGGTVSGAGTYDYGTSVTIAATANVGFTFNNWTEDGEMVSTDESYTFTIYDDHDFVANFTINTYNVTVAAYPVEGGTVIGAGTYNHGSSVTVTATANTGYTFDNWTEDGEVVSTDESYTFTIYDNHDFIANFTINTYNVTVTANPAEGGTVTGAGTYDYSTSVTIAATANVGYIFNNWTEDGEMVSTDASYTFTITDDHDFVANFTINTYNVTVAANPVEGGTVTGAGTYDYGTSVTITATAIEEYSFINWTEDGEVVSTDESYIFIIANDHDFVANFAMITYDVTVTANPVEGGIVTGAGTYAEGRPVTISATANVGYTFDNWTEDGEVVSTDESYTFTIYDDHDFIANFTINTYNVTVAANPAEGGTVTGAGTYDYGTSVTITATANVGYTFNNWTEDGEMVSTDESYTISITDDHDFVANFTINTYNVTVAADPVEGGTVTGAGTYDYGTSVTITATAIEEYSFINWTEDGEVVSTDETYTFIIANDHDFVANFAMITYDVTVTANPVEGGIVTGAGTYAEGRPVTVTATANTGYTFDNWTEEGEVVSTDESYTFTIYDDHDFIANFTINTYNVTVTANPAEGGTVTGAGTYDYGTSVTIAATANIGYTFNNWTEDGEMVSTYESYTFTIADDHDFAANFTINTYNVTVAADPVEGGTVTGAGTYDYGTSVTVAATAIEEYSFINWTEDGEVVSTNESYTFTIYDDHDFVANFAMITYDVTVTANPVEAGIVTGAGTYAEGRPVTITATANTGYTFDNWTEEGELVSTDESYTFTIYDDHDFVANFTIITYEVTVTANPVEGGTVTGAGTYDYGTSVTVTATANDGYTFYRWTENGSDVSYSSTYSFVVTEDRNLVANFVTPSMNILSIGDYTGAEGEILTIDINLANENEVAGFQFDIPLNEGFTYVEGSIVKGVRCAPSHIILTQVVGDGTTLRVICYSVNPPANISGNDGTIASLQIILGEGGIYELGLENCIISSIYGYSLPCIGIGGSLTVGTFNVTVAANPAEGGTVTGAGTYDYGTSVTVTATANEFYVFVNWTEGDVEVSTDASYTFTITEDHDLVANFILPGLLGDANNDHVVNVADVQAVVSYLYGYYLPTFNFINADANEDGIIDIGDIQAILMIIHDDHPDKSMGGKPVIYTIENGVLNISLTEELSAMQIMVDAPIEIANTDVFDGFTTVIDRVQGTDSYMLLAYSLEGKTVKPGKYAILNIADGTIEQMTFSTPTAATVDGIEGDPLGIGEETVAANVYPNPTQGMITIEAENMSEIVIANMMGQIVARYADINGSSANINMNGFEKGTYLVRIITGSSVIVKNVVKM